MDEQREHTMERLDIPPLARRVISLLRERENPEFRKRADSAAQSLLQESFDQTHAEQNGLIAYLMISHLTDQLEQGVINQLQGALRSSMNQSPLVKDVLQKTTVLTQEAQAFQEPTHPQNYYMVTLTGNTLADLILSLETHKVSKITRKKSSLRDNPNLVIEPFASPEKKSVGIWMSTQGKHFAPGLIK